MRDHAASGSDSNGDGPFAAALERFSSADATDPRGAAATYHETVASWVDRLDPSASIALRLAARCQHLKRHESPRSAFPEGPAGYKRWRAEAARKHATEAAAILTSVGFDAPTIEHVQALLTKRSLRSDPDCQTLEDAACLTFLELELERFAGKHEDEKVVAILRKTWTKMSERGRGAAVKLARGLPVRLTELIATATSSS